MKESTYNLIVNNFKVLAEEILKCSGTEVKFKNPPPAVYGTMQDLALKELAYWIEDCVVQIKGGGE